MLSRRELANAIRALSMDAVEKAQSGHPGMPMGMADIAEVLWNTHLKHNPQNPKWYNRDRFVISNGHGSMLLYSLLHLTGYDLPLSELQNFRQLHSKTPGHPEYDYAPGIETTTGPLGQGLANAVGMAIAEKILAKRFNRTDHCIVDHCTYVFVGDGCLMEGISHEVCSLAGTLGLGKLIVIYDDNGISIDGPVAGHEQHPCWFTDDTPNRFAAYNWHVAPNVDGHSPEAINAAIAQARDNHAQPSIICCKTTIGFGAPNKQNTAGCHGAPLGPNEIAAAREQLNWQHPPFTIPDEIYNTWDAKDKGEQQEAQWQQIYSEYEKCYPDLAAEFQRRMQGLLPNNFTELTQQLIQVVDEKEEHLASRKASLNCLNFLGPLLPELLGGSADLTGSNLTLWQSAKGITHDHVDGNYIYYGVREFGMCAIMNGIALHGGFIPYGGTFLIFMEYARNAIRMAALMKQQCIFVFTHDSIGLGEDGPTHQPVEQLANLRLTPNISLWRPCDAVESAVAWQMAIKRQDGPTALIFSRQTLNHQQRDSKQISNISKGGYILYETNQDPDVIIIATGSEVSIAMEAAKQLTNQNLSIRVVSMPSTDLFDGQDQSYRESVLPSNITQRIAIEAAQADYWYKYVGLHGRIIGMRTFGESAPADDLFAHFGITVDNAVNVINEMIGKE